jgi:hypothetical protein
MPLEGKRESCGTNTRRSLFLMDVVIAVAFTWSYLFFSLRLAKTKIRALVVGSSFRKSQLHDS